MAEVEKFNDDGVMMLLKHSDRQLKNDSNKDIIESKKDLNYSIAMDTNGLTPREYYKEIVGSSYLYGRGTKREKEAVTACSWVVTLPKEISDYTQVGKDEIKILNEAEEKAFFQGAFDFVYKRYPGCVFYSKVHYDEGGQPHIHIYFVPKLELDHEQVKYKTTNTHKAVKTSSGRYLFEYRFKLEDGKKVPLKNYAKMSDYYDYKISGADVLNKAELQHFHQDFATYLRDNNLPGANLVYTGKTGNKNISVKALKEFTKATNIKLDELKVQPLEAEKLREILEQTNLSEAEKLAVETINKDAIIEHLKTETYNKETLIESLKEELTTKVKTFDRSDEIANKNEQIRDLSQTVSEQSQELAKATELNSELLKKIAEMEQTIEATQGELGRAQARLEELEKQNTVEVSQPQGWGQKTASWGDKSQAGWGTKTTSIEEEKTW